MPPTPLQHRRAHNTLLLHKLLDLRDGASPFTLVLDDLEGRGAWGVVGVEFVRRARINKTKVVFVSFRTLRRPQLVDVFVRGRKKPLKDLRAEILSNLPAPGAQSKNGPKPPDAEDLTRTGIETLLVFDTLNPLCNASNPTLPAFLSSLLSPSVSILAIYHTDIPPPTPPPPYTPHPLTTLRYLATALLTTHSLAQTLAQKAARDRSLPDPTFGLSEHREGVLTGLSPPQTLHAQRPTAAPAPGIVLAMELRRKSGRGIRDTFVLIPATAADHQPPRILLLDDHPFYAPPETAAAAAAHDRTPDDATTDHAEVSFSLSLTEKQRRDRDGVVLPYFEAQREGFAGGGAGRILYEMGREDDFDEEEDEG